MDHAEAIARIANLALEPALLASIDTDPSPEGEALRAHAAACAWCATELAGWRRSWSAMAIRDAGEAVPPPAPPSLRERTRLAVAAETRLPGSRGDAPHGRGVLAARRRRPWPWLAAAAVVLALGAAGFGLLRGGEADRIRTENAGLAATTAALATVLADPDHWVTGLHAIDGGAGSGTAGTVAWTDDEVVVVASGLPALEPGQAYRCWVERDGVRTPIGPMALSGSTGYWVGSMAGWGNMLGPGGTFGVSVASGGGPTTPVLLGEL